MSATSQAAKAAVRGTGSSSHMKPRVCGADTRRRGIAEPVIDIVSLEKTGPILWNAIRDPLLIFIKDTALRTVTKWRWMVRSDEGGFFVSRAAGESLIKPRNSQAASSEYMIRIEIWKRF